MKKNIIVKIVFITLIFIMCFSVINSVYAGSMFTPSNYKPNVLNKNDAKSVFKMGEKLFGILRNIATVVAILTIAIIGVKFMFGSVDQKAEYKATLLPWFFGAIFVVMLTTILGIIESIAQKI